METQYNSRINMMKKYARLATLAGTLALPYYARAENIQLEAETNNISITKEQKQSSLEKEVVRAIGLLLGAGLNGIIKGLLEEKRED